MTTLNVRNHEGEPLARTVELPAEVFDVTVNVPLVHQVVVGQLAAARQGTSKTKTRGEVRGGGAKPYRQKGTGRARQGSTRSPQFTGGGVVHGPVPRDYSQRTPKKMKAAALRSALSDRARGDRVHVVDRLVVGDTPSTKAAVAALHPLTYGRGALVVALRTDLVTWKSLRNVPDVHLLDPGQLNTYDVLVSDDVVFLEDALVSFLAASGRGARRGTTGPDTPPDLAPHRISSAVPSEVVGEFSTGETPAESAAPSSTSTASSSTATAPTAAGGTVTENAATSAGSTQAAGDGVSDDEMAREVAAETSSDLDAEPVFEAQHDGAETDTEMAKASPDEISEEVDPR